MGGIHPTIASSRRSFLARLKRPLGDLKMSARQSNPRWAILGLATTCVILSIASFALEYFFPINSGVGPDSQLFALIHTLPIAIAVFVCSSVIAAVFRWNPLAARHHEFLFGALCGLSQAYSVLIRLGVPVKQLNINDLTFSFVVLVIAIFGRYCLATRSAANA